MKNNVPLLIGLLAGIAGGLMVLAAFNAGILAFFLLFAAPAAVYIASMGWGTFAGIIAAGVASVLAGAFATGELAMVTAVLLFAPAAWVGHLVNLGQRAGDGSGRVIWYPLSAILLRLMIALAAGFLVVGMFSGYSREVFVTAVMELMRQMGEANPDMQTLDETAQMANAVAMARMLPIVVPCMWLLSHVITAFASAGITRRSGLLARGREDVAGTVNLPIEAAGFMAAGLIGTTMLSGTPADAAGVFLGLAMGGYGLIGLAQMHYRLRANPSRGLVLGIAYAMIVMFSVPLLIFTVMGLWRSLSRNSSSGPTPPGPSGPSGPGGGGPANPA